MLLLSGRAVERHPRFSSLRYFLSLAPPREADLAFSQLTAPPLCGRAARRQRRRAGRFQRVPAIGVVAASALASCFVDRLRCLSWAGLGSALMLTMPRCNPCLAEMVSVTVRRALTTLLPNANRALMIRARRGCRFGMEIRRTR